MPDVHTANPTDDISPVSAEYHLAKIFVEDEMQLLDSAAYERWMDLFTDDGLYWVPVDRNQESPIGHVSLFNDNKEIMRTRVERLRHPMIHVQIPASRSCRMLSSVRVKRRKEGSGLVVTGKYLLVEYRPGHNQQVIAGDAEYHLVETGAGLKIHLKKIVLINSDGVFPALAVPI